MLSPMQRMMNGVDTTARQIMPRRPDPSAQIAAAMGPKTPPTQIGGQNGGMPGSIANPPMPAGPTGTLPPGAPIDPRALEIGQQLFGGSGRQINGGPRDAYAKPNIQVNNPPPVPVAKPVISGPLPTPVQPSYAPTSPPGGKSRRIY